MRSDFTPEGKGQLIILTSDNLSDENFFDNPTKVAPVTAEVEIADKSFFHEFLPYSVTILRIR